MRRERPAVRGGLALRAPPGSADHARIDRVPAASSRVTTPCDPLRQEFHSILFPGPEPAAFPVGDRAPAFFRDLNLDQIVAAVTVGRQEYDLAGFFLRPLRDIDALEYRHDVMRELQNPGVLERIRTFGSAMRTMRSHLATVEKLRYKEQSDAWFVDAVEVYCQAVARLAEDLGGLRLRSRGLTLFRQYLSRYAGSDGFIALQNGTAALKDALCEIRYGLLIRDSSILVHRYAGESDYSAEVAATFAKFAQGAAKSYLVEFQDCVEMNHVEAAILSKIARLHPVVFAELKAYRERHSGYCEPKIAAFDREIQFYMSYLEHMARLQRAGLQFCYPRLSLTSKAVHADETYDLALAHQLVAEDKVVIPNDFHLEDKERIFVVSGPNQGGKTTFARTFGQLHYLASLGLPVPGRRARLFLCDRIFSHFEKEKTCATCAASLRTIS